MSALCMNNITKTIRTRRTHTADTSHAGIFSFLPSALVAFTISSITCSFTTEEISLAVLPFGATVIAEGSRGSGLFLEYIKHGTICFSIPGPTNGNLTT